MREQTGYNTVQSSRSRTGTSSGIHPEDHPYNTESYPDIWGQTRLPTSTRRYQGTGTPRNVIQVTHHPGQPIQRASRMRQQYTQDPETIVPQLLQKAQSKREKKGRLSAGKHPLFYIGSVCVLFMLGWFLISALINWIHVTLDDLHYGRPRTYQTDMDVGHGGVSHFTVENLGGHIVVYELSNNDPSKAKIYSGSTLVGGDPSLMPVTLTFRKVNGDGLLDMIIVVDGNEYATFTGGKDGMFHPPVGG
jgi:hypothetical protein